MELLGFGAGDYLELIELGAGDGTKTVELLRALCKKDHPFEYCPVDISENALKKLESDLNRKCPKLRLKPLRGDYFEVLERLKDTHHKKVVLFLGSNIGNLRDEKASVFLHELDQTMNLGDRLLLGVDLIKSESVVLPAYNDSKGVTSEFNLNLLSRINRELDADFDLDGFVHKPEYDEQTGIAASYLESRQEQKVQINGMGVYSFKKGERILTEISRKYNDEILSEILESTRFEIVDKILDKDKLFADYILEITEKADS
jgi:dimethylhistidine N-methyltransferase